MFVLPFAWHRLETHLGGPVESMQVLAQYVITALVVARRLVQALDVDQAFAGAG